MHDMLEYLKKRAPTIDEQIRKIFPERIDEKYAEWAFGPARYTYDTKSIEEVLSKPIWDFLNRGGKRWRPAMLLLVAEALGADPDKLLEFAAIPELAHEGSLLSDDIEDQAELRRGKPCIHKLFGVDVAINAGSFMYFLPLLVLIKNKTLDKAVLLKAYETYSQELMNVHIGQGLDICWHNGRNLPTESQYLQMCALKTGTLARLSAKLGVILANGTDEQVEKLGRMAEAIGIGFQIQDDILSASGGKFSERKGFGDDVTEGKRTLLVIHTLDKADDKDRKRLLEILDMHTRDRGLIKEALALLEKYGSVEYAKQKAIGLVTRAWEEAAPLIPEGSAKNRLKSFVDFLVNREI